MNLTSSNKQEREEEELISGHAERSMAMGHAVHWGDTQGRLHCQDTHVTHQGSWLCSRDGVLHVHCGLGYLLPVGLHSDEREGL